jgi:hypothetical protein
MILQDKAFHTSNSAYKYLRDTKIQMLIKPFNIKKTVNFQHISEKFIYRTIQQKR